MSPHLNALKAGRGIEKYINVGSQVSATATGEE